MLSAERYGVPQTRKRAFLIASLDGPVSLPEPTHRSYNARRKETPEDEQALLPWVSMAEALGWTPSEEVGFPRRNDTPSNHPSKTDTGTYRQRDRRPACNPAPTLTAKTRSWTRKPCVQIRRSGERITEGFDPTSAPAQAVTTRVNRWQANGVQDGWAWRNGNQPNAAIRDQQEPAPTVHFGRALNQVEWVPTAYETRQRGARPRPISKPAPRCWPPAWRKARRFGRASVPPRPSRATGESILPATRRTRAILPAATSSGAVLTPCGSRSSRPRYSKASPRTTRGRA